MLSFANNASISLAPFLYRIIGTGVLICFSSVIDILLMYIFDRHQVLKQSAYRVHVHVYCDILYLLILSKSMSGWNDLSKFPYKQIHSGIATIWVHLNPLHHSIHIGRCMLLFGSVFDVRASTCCIFPNSSELLYWQWYDHPHVDDIILAQKKDRPLSKPQPTKSQHSINRVNITTGGLPHNETTQWDYWSHWNSQWYIIPFMITQYVSVYNATISHITI